MSLSPAAVDMQQLIRQLRNPNLRVGDGRRHKRVKCFWLAMVRHGACRRECIVEDISVGGCRVTRTDGLLLAGEIVSIEIPEQKMELSAMVMWARGAAAGLCFKLPCH